MILILFVLYINDLPDLLRNACKLYAGDSKIIAILRNIITPKLLQRDIDLVTSRTNDWMMQLNTGKCSFMHFGGRSGNSCVGTTYSIENLSACTRSGLRTSTSERDLGVLVSSDLRWKAHVDAIVSRANKVLGILMRQFMNLHDSWRRLLETVLRVT